MRRVFLPLLGMLFGTMGSAQVVITSLSQNGLLSWTNSTSPANYRVEWAASPSGPWNSFSLLTNLNLISATSNRVSVQVPMFYRVVWTDAPTWAGGWSYTAFDWSSNLVATGRFYLLPKGDNAYWNLTGTWAIQPVGNPPWAVAPQSGSGKIIGSIGSMGTTNHLFLYLLSNRSDDDFGLVGDITGSESILRGEWWNYPHFGTTFQAVKE